MYSISFGEPGLTWSDAVKGHAQRSVSNGESALGITERGEGGSWERQTANNPVGTKGSQKLIQVMGYESEVSV